MLTREFVKTPFEFARERPWLAVSNPTTVDLDNWNDFRGATRQEALLGDVHVVSSERHLVYRFAHLVGQIDHGLSSDPLEDPSVSGRRMDLIVADEKNIVTGTLRIQNYQLPIG